MKRMVWIAATLLIMIAILGFGLHTLNDIDKKNKEYREQKEGQAVASMIAVIPATTSVWDRLRATETAAAVDAAPAPAPANEQPAEQIVPEAPAGNEPVVPDAPEQTPEQTNTVADGVIVVSP